MMNVRAVRGLVSSWSPVLRQRFLLGGQMSSVASRSRRTHVGPTYASSSIPLQTGLLPPFNVTRLGVQEADTPSLDSSLDTSEEGPGIPISVVKHILDNYKIHEGEPVQAPNTQEDADTTQKLFENDMPNSVASQSGLVPRHESSRNLWKRTPPLRPPTGTTNFKETYLKLKRLGLLKTQKNCLIGMTSPSGNYQRAERAHTVKPAAPRRPPKLADVKSKFLQNNVVLKVQRYYNSLDKEMPEELKYLSKGRSRRGQPSERPSRLRFQAFPCTSPSALRLAKHRAKGNPAY